MKTSLFVYYTQTDYSKKKQYLHKLGCCVYLHRILTRTHTHYYRPSEPLKLCYTTIGFVSDFWRVSVDYGWTTWLELRLLLMAPTNGRTLFLQHSWTMHFFLCDVCGIWLWTFLPSIRFIIWFLTIYDGRSVKDTDRL